MMTPVQPNVFAKYLLMILAITVVLGCVALRALVPGGWALLLFVIPYFIILYTHAFIHIAYANIGWFSPRRYCIIAVSHMLLLLGVLFQWDFTDTAFTWAPIMELLPITPIRPSSHGWQLVVDPLVLLPAIISWAWLWHDRKKMLRATSEIRHIPE